MKIIKFDLPINGIKAKNLEELRDNLTDEIVGLARSGQLARWFTSRQLEDKAKAVAAAVPSAPEDKALFLALCEILEVEAHPDDVNAIFDAPPEAGKVIKDAGATEPPNKLEAFIKELSLKIKPTIYELGGHEGITYSESLTIEINKVRKVVEVVRFAPEIKNSTGKVSSLKYIGESVKRHESILSHINGESLFGENIRSRVSGVVRNIYVKRGDNIRGNQLLMVIEGTEIIEKISDTIDL